MVTKAKEQVKEEAKTSVAAASGATKSETTAEDTKPSREAFMAAVFIRSGNDLINYGKLQKATFRSAVSLGVELDKAYTDYVVNK